ncbi:hypothetical protein ACFLUH_01170 [Chloroflexota bacterium]
MEMLEPDRRNFCIRRKKLWWRTIGFTLIILLLSLPVVTPVEAALFYTGNIHVESLSAEIGVTTQAEVNVTYILTNLSDSTEAVSLSVFPKHATALVDGVAISNPSSFEPGQKKELTVSYNIELASSALQKITFNPILYFNDMSSSHRINEYGVQIVLPEGIERIVSSNKPYDEGSIQDGRLVLTWQKEDIYPSSLNVTWTTLTADIAAVKAAIPDMITEAGEVIEVEITIENQGREEVRNLQLIDSFFPGTFEAVKPLDEFELVESEISDPHLYWTKKIDKLLPGEKQSYHYSVKVIALGLQTRLDSLVIMVDEIPVATSNDIVLYDELAESREGWISGIELPLKYIVVGCVVLAGIVSGTVYYKRRKKSQANTGK